LNAEVAGAEKRRGGQRIKEREIPEHVIGRASEAFNVARIADGVRRAGSQLREE
jgi:hypothetical protein